SSPGASSSKNVYKVTSPEQSNLEQSVLSFIPNGYRRINIEDQSPLRQHLRNQEASHESDRNLLASPFVRRALPPLPRDRENRSSRFLNQSATSSASVLDQLRSQGYRSVLAGFGSNRIVPLSSMTPEERQRFLD